MGFQGFFDQGVAGVLLFLLDNDSGAPVEPTGTPTFRVYGPSGVVANGSGNGSSFESGNVTGATNASPIVVTSAAHGLTVGQSVTVANVAGNTGANGTFLVSARDANTFTLGDSTGNGAYTSGGTWRTTGMYQAAIAGAMLSALVAGTTYTAVMTYVTGGSTRTKEATFTVR